VLVACLTSFETVRTAEIYYLSLIRAKFCELLAGRSTSHQLSSEAFMVGLFSLLDVILETPLDELMGQIAVSPDVVKALKQQDGVLYDYVMLAQLYEQRLWSEASDKANQLGCQKVR
jgi:EAL and modified HD-GYP domain-containing signal transduction protein